jgi:hypothetical protein
MIRKAHLTLEAVYERDIDLLLVEELRASHAFQRLFLDALARSQAAQHLLPPAYAVPTVHVKHSVSRDDSDGLVPARFGETDIEVVFSWREDGSGVTSERCIQLLIENKIAAQFRPDQPERYRAFARRTHEEIKTRSAFTLLVAPKGYLKTAPGAAIFDARISYEEVEEHLRARAAENVGTELGDRLVYRADITAQAVASYRRGFVSIPHAAVTTFWRSYYGIATSHAPELRMKAPRVAGQARRNRWIDFPPDILVSSAQGVPMWPAGARHNIKHKLREGLVDLHLSRWGEREEEAHALVDPLLDTGMTLRRAHGSMAVSCAVPAIDPEQPPEPQAEAIRAGLDAALALKAWYGRCAAQLILPSIDEPQGS